MAIALSGLRDYLLTPINVVAWIIATSFLVISGPFGTFGQQSLYERLLYWPGVVLLSLVACYVTKVAITAFFPRMSYLHQTVFGGAAFGPIFTGPLWVFSEWMTQGQTAMAMSPFLMLLITTWIGLCMAVLRFVLESKPAVEETVEAPRLINRIEGYQGEGVMRLTVNDHFVEIVTLTGEIHRLRLRFSDAVREMAPVEGFCVHRSHWVSRAAISRVERESGRETVRMVDGSHVPIGRKYRSNLVDAGLV